MAPKKTGVGWPAMFRTGCCSRFSGQLDVFPSWFSAAAAVDGTRGPFLSYPSCMLITPILHAPSPRPRKDRVKPTLVGCQAITRRVKGHSPVRRSRRAAILPGQRVPSISLGYPSKPLHGKSGLTNRNYRRSASGVDPDRVKGSKYVRDCLAGVGGTRLNQRRRRWGSALREGECPTGRAHPQRFSRSSSDPGH